MLFTLKNKNIIKIQQLRKQQLRRQQLRRQQLKRQQLRRQQLKRQQIQNNTVNKNVLCVVSMFKNESHILKEWLDHYINEGVEYFFMIDNGSNDN